MSGKSLWILNHYAVPPNMPGGTRHYDLGQELCKRGYDVTILASSFHHSLRQEMRLREGKSWKVEEVDGLKFVWLRTFPYQRNDWRRVVDMVSYMVRSYCLGRRLPRLDTRIPRPDVIIGSSVHLLAVLSAYYLASHYHAHFLMEVRDVWPQTLIDMGVLSERHPAAWAMRKLEAFLYQRAERIVILSPLTEGYLAQFGIDEDKWLYLPNGTDTRRFELLSATEEGDSAQFKLLYLGAHGASNDLDVVLEAARAIQTYYGGEPISFTFVGDGPEKPRLKQLAAELNLSNVRFQDPVPKSEVPSTLSMADALILIQGKVLYGSSNKLFDYMASGKPIIFAVWAEHNAVSESRCGLSVPPRNPEALAKAVIQLYKMPRQERRAMGERGREYVKKYHDWAILAGKFQECIEEVCSQCL